MSQIRYNWFIALVSIPHRILGMIFSSKILLEGSAFLSNSVVFQFKKAIISDADI